MLPLFVIDVVGGGAAADVVHVAVLITVTVASAAVVVVVVVTARWWAEAATFRLKSCDRTPFCVSLCGTPPTLRQMGVEWKQPACVSFLWCLLVGYLD